MGHRLMGRPLHVDVQQRDGEGAVWLEVEHDGWVHDYGLLHQRRLYLDQRLDEVRAEAGSNSSRQPLDEALPDCIAVLAGQ